MALQRIAGRVGFQGNEKVDQLDRNVAGSKNHCGTLQLSYMMSRGQQVEHHAQGFRVEKPRCQFVSRNQRKLFVTTVQCTYRSKHTSQLRIGSECHDVCSRIRMYRVAVHSRARL